MNKKIIIFCFSVLILVFVIGIASSSIIQRPNISADLTSAEKTGLLERYNANGYKINKCWSKGNDYFCDIEIGNLKLNRFLVTSEYDREAVLLELDETCVKELVGTQMIGRTITKDDCYMDKGTKLTRQELLEKKLVIYLRGLDLPSSGTTEDNSMNGVVKKW